MKIDIAITHEGVTQYPVVQEGIELSLEWRGSPGKLTFTILKDDTVNFQEGDVCQLSVDGAHMFSGFVFTKKRGVDGLVSVTAYDQLRYLKNKDTILYENKTASELVRMLAEDFQLNTGTIEDTGYKIEYRVEADTTLFDIIQNALNATLMVRGQHYALYDDYGKLTLKSLESMKTNLMLDLNTIGDFDYQSSIDNDTYNQIKVVNKKTGQHVLKNDETINLWGVLQLVENVEDNVNPQTVAAELLKTHNVKHRSLTANNVLGRTDIRAGSSVIVRLNLGDINISNSYMMCESVRHTFKERHLMQLKLRGGFINA